MPGKGGRGLSPEDPGQGEGQGEEARIAVGGFLGGGGDAGGDEGEHGETGSWQRERNRIRRTALLHCNMSLPNSRTTGRAATLACTGDMPGRGPC